MSLNTDAVAKTARQNSVACSINNAVGNESPRYKVFEPVRSVIVDLIVKGFRFGHAAPVTMAIASVGNSVTFTPASSYICMATGWYLSASGRGATTCEMPA